MASPFLLVLMASGLQDISTFLPKNTSIYLYLQSTNQIHCYHSNE